MESGIVQDIANFLKKKVTLESDQLEYLATRILSLVPARLGQVALPYSAFERERADLSKESVPANLRYVQGDTIVSHSGVTEMTEPELRVGLDDLVQLNILRVGVHVRCKFCGVRTWYHVDKLKQVVSCSGCGQRQGIGAQEQWCYALNSVAQASVAQGQLAVLQALAALATFPCRSFFFSPNLELFRDDSSNPWHEVDVVALVDGEFVIGEVKEGKRLTRHDFNELADIAEVLRPQRAIMFLLLDTVSAEVKGWLGEMDARLSPQGIKAQIFALPTF